MKTKTKKVSQILPHTTTISSLPDDLVLICLARVSRLDYRAISLVSKKFRSLIDSPELYKVRSVLGNTETCVYVCSWFPDKPHLRWFTLCRRPNNGTTKKKGSDYLFVPIPSPQYVPIRASNFVSNGAEIYVTGGTNDGFNVIDLPSPSVWIMDSRSHTWHQAPNMKVARKYGAAKAIDEKVYVAGGFRDKNSPDWIECFDPKTQTWNSVVSTRIDEICELLLFSHCVVDNVMCYYDDGKFKWYEKDGSFWDSRIVNGLIGLLKCHRLGVVRLVNYNGKMAVLWEKKHDRCSIAKESVYWCAVIALERRSSKEIWGTVEWSDALLNVPEDHSFFSVVATKL